MTDLRDGINPQAGRLAAEAHEEAKPAVVEPPRITRKIKTARGARTLKLVKVGRREIVLPS